MAEVEAAPDLTSDGGGREPQTQEPRPKKTRNRLPVSCEPCRIRRAKCDRERPYCGACSKRGEMEKCIYQTRGPKHGAKSEDGVGRIPVAETEDRLRHLESLITQVVQAGRLNTGYQNAPPNGYAMQPSPISPAAEPAETSDPGQLSAIVADLQELRSLITGDNPSGVVDDAYEEKTVLLGASTTPSLEFILHQYLPERLEVEAYLATYFRAPYVTIPVVHPESFQRQLQEFWRIKPNADPIWVGLLFAILSLAAHITTISTGDASSAADRFTTASAQCINLGGYTRPKKHLIPALLLLAQSQYMRRLDPSREVRMVVSIICQLAFHSGLHREPPRHIPVFEAEMRRRLWFMVRHFEVQVACQFGVPSVIPYNAYDVNEPRNLREEDLTEDMTSLPEARDWSEPTALASFLIKARLMDVLSEVYHHALSVRTNSVSGDNSDEATHRLDAAIRHEHSQIPARYKIRPISESYLDPESLVISRLTLEFLAQKTLCILHRRRMAEGKDEYSRMSCIDAASRIIQYTNDLIPEFAPGRQLQGKPWILTSTIVNDFLLASMILCLGVVTEERVANSNTSRRRNASETEKLRKQIDLLNKARSLCVELSPRSRGAKRVGEAISLLFSRLQQNASIDPQLPLPYSGVPVPVPLTASSANVSANGLSSSASVGGYASYLPTPTPSSTMSQERSTYSQQRYPSAPQSQMPAYDYAANVAAAAGAEPLPVPNTSQMYSDPGVGAAAAANAALYQTQMQSHGSDPIYRFMTDTSGGEEIDWTAFDQYIFNEGWSGFE